MADYNSIEEWNRYLDYKYHPDRNLPNPTQLTRIKFDAPYYDFDGRLKSYNQLDYDQKVHKKAEENRKLAKRSFKISFKWFNLAFIFTFLRNLSTILTYLL